MKPMHVVLSEDGSKGYVSSGRDKMVFIFDTATNQVRGFDRSGRASLGYRTVPEREASLRC